MRRAKSGRPSLPDSSSDARSAVVSAARRERTNVKVRAPSATRAAIIHAASVVAARRTGAPFWPSMPSMNPGSHKATVRAPVGAPSSVTASMSRPVSRSACAAGSRMVAEAATTTGREP